MPRPADDEIEFKSKGRKMPKSEDKKELPKEVLEWFGVMGKDFTGQLPDPRPGQSTPPTIAV